MGESDAAGGSALRRTRAPRSGRGEELPFDAAQLDWVYPHAASAVIPSKVTATQLKGRALDQEIAENAAPERRVRAVSFEKPRFLQKERGLTAAERGTAMHAVMQYLDFARPADEQSVREQVMQLRERGCSRPSRQAAIDVHEIAQFLRSPAGAAHPTGGNALQGIPICASRSGDAL